jgi:cardiolipin synthase
MSCKHFNRLNREAIPSLRILADQAFSRAAGAPLVPGNRVRLLKDAKENYPAWLAAIDSATNYIHFESFIIHEDEIGRQFAEALAEKVRQGVRVRLLYDWFGDLGYASRRFWRRLRQAGVEVRCFNPPRFDSPFGWLSRDHRKMLSVDGRVAFVFGLCIGRRWVGEAERGTPPWRDTGIEIRGPAIADIEQAFSQTWGLAGPPLPEDELPQRSQIAPAGDVMLRVIASAPSTAELYRLDHLIAAGARHSLWLTDAYFIGTTSYIQALRSAALDGVDVRLLVPGASDVALMRALSRAGYRPLLEAGVRIFEWNGPMLHAKTAVADGRWARVGSTNLNLSSWIGNWELDIAIENERFARAMEEMYLQDLTNATEIVLSKHKRMQPILAQPRRRKKPGRGSVRRVAAGAIEVGNAVGAAITNHRMLGPAEAKIMASAGTLLLGLAIVALLWPLVLTVPLATLSGWIAVALLVRAYKLRHSASEHLEVIASSAQQGHDWQESSKLPLATDNESEPAQASITGYFRESHSLKTAVLNRSQAKLKSRIASKGKSHDTELICQAGTRDKARVDQTSTTQKTNAARSF